MKNFIKIILEKLLTLLLVILTFPLQLIIFIIILIELKEFPLFFQRRGLTFEKKLFTVIKFKTISSRESNSIQHNKTEDIFFLNKKVRIRPISKFLRLTGLDELPQLFNILAGAMNYIGPRPLMIEELNILRSKYPEYYEIRNNISSKPGITGLWQVIGDRKKGVEELISLEMFYETNRSLKLNFIIIYYTLILMITGNNSDALIPRLEFISQFASRKLTKYKLIYKMQKKLNLSYQIRLPENWWTSNNSLKSNYKNEESELKIFKINKR